MTDTSLEPDSPQPDGEKPHTPAPGPRSRPHSGADQAAEARVPSHIVGVGASAGGLNPLEEFFREIPEETDAAFVVVQHLSPDFKSLMREILSRVTRLEVVRAEAGMVCRPGHVYLIPPRRDLTISGGRLDVQEQAPSREGPPHPIDVFFESLARDQRERSVAIILSGTGTDGCKGVRSIAEAGGLVLSQSPETAQFDGMPRAAISTGLVHKSESPTGLAGIVTHYIRDTQNAGEGDLGSALQDGEGVAEVAAILRRDGGVDFSHYRRSTIARRIARRLTITGHTELSSYLHFLDDSNEERQALRSDLLIGVTCFFRDPEVWDLLATEILPDLVRQAAGRGVLRAWVSACATAEEAYTLAILILEVMDALQLHFDVKMFATDIDARALEQGANGLYPASIVADVGEERIQRFFTRQGDGYRVSRRLREMIIFAEHNLTRDAPFTKMDLVTCRNVLIYMEPALQEQVLGLLHFSLRQQGTLVLGSAETVGRIADEFETVDSKGKIFRKVRDIPVRIDSSPRLGVMRPLPGSRRRYSTPPTGLSSLGEASINPDSTIVRAFRQLVADHSLSCLIVDGLGQLQHVIGRATDYLQVPEGSLTSDIYRLAHPALAVPISTALHQARKSDTPVRYGSIQVEIGANETRLVELTVRHHTATAREGADFYLLMIREETAALPFRRGDGEAAPVVIDRHAKEQIEDLERELQATRESLQATIEELETTNEEQQSTNEELVAANEELQSTNEELQSVNEELFTVNAEFQAKNVELMQLNADIDNLLRTIQIGTVFLDAHLMVRKFTPAARLALHVEDRDVGRRITDLAHRTDCPDLYDLITGVRDQRKEVERVLHTSEGRRLLMRSFPYHSGDEGGGGVVLTFIEIDFLERLDRHGGAWLRALQSAGRATLMQWSGSDDEVLVSPPPEPGDHGIEGVRAPRMTSLEAFLQDVAVADRNRVLEVIQSASAAQGPIRTQYTRVAADGTGTRCLLIGRHDPAGEPSTLIELPIDGADPTDGA